MVSISLYLITSLLFKRNILCLLKYTRRASLSYPCERDRCAQLVKDFLLLEGKDHQGQLMNQERNPGGLDQFA